MHSFQEVEIDGRFLEFCGIKPSDDPQHKPWQLTSQEDKSDPPAWLESLLIDCNIALSCVDNGAGYLAPSRPRVDAILHYSLARAKKKALTRAGVEPGAPRKLDTLFWGYEQVIDLSRDCQGSIDKCALDYVLWHGDQPDLETNLVVINGGARQYFSMIAALCECSIYARWDLFT